MMVKGGLHERQPIAFGCTKRKKKKTGILEILRIRPVCPSQLPYRCLRGSWLCGCGQERKRQG
jgi:hypothetical protein